MASSEVHKWPKLREIYDTFFFRTFRAPRAVWKFIRTWFAACLRPGRINPETECGPGKKFVDPVRFAESLFGLAIAAAIGGFLSQDISNNGENESKVASDLTGFLVGSFENAYLLWLYCSALIAGVLAARLWVRLSKSEAFETEHLTSLFIYEFGVLFLPLLGIIYIFEYTVLDLFIGGIKPESKAFFAAYPIFSVSHLLLFLLVLGRCAKLTIWRSVWSAAVVVLALVFLFLLGMILSIPFYLLPLLLLLYPVYALVRKFMSKAAFAEKFFEGIEGRITSGDALLSPREQARPEEGGSTS